MSLVRKPLGWNVRAELMHGDDTHAQQRRCASPFDLRMQQPRCSGAMDNGRDSNFDRVGWIGCDAHVKEPLAFDSPSLQFDTVLAMVGSEPSRSLVRLLRQTRVLPDD